MDITNLLKNNESTAFSFEVLPPLKGKGLDTINNTIELLREFDPKYINITTHHSEVYFRDAGNGLYQVERLRRRPGTVAVAAAIQNKYGIPVVPHVLCSGFTKEETEYLLRDHSRHKTFYETFATNGCAQDFPLRHSRRICKRSGKVQK